jgi:hypothetical protein
MSQKKRLLGTSVIEFLAFEDQTKFFCFRGANKFFAFEDQYKFFA